MNILKSLFMITALSWGITAAGLQAAVVNAPAPDFELADINGKVHRLSDFKGKFVVLEWINLDCPFVRKHYDSGNMQKIQRHLTDEGAVWLSINSSAEGKQGYFEGEELLRRVSDEHSAATAYLIDTSGRVGQLYGAQTTPHMYVIDPEGRLIYQGAIDSLAGTDPAQIDQAQNYVLAAYNEAREGSAVTIPQTKAYGCSVKY